MKHLNLNQRKIIVDLIINLITAWISISFISQVLVEKRIDFYSLLLALIALIISAIMLLFSISFMSK